jgi:hypothetical protein
MRGKANVGEKEVSEGVKVTERGDLIQVPELIGT